MVSLEIPIVLNSSGTLNSPMTKLWSNTRGFSEKTNEQQDEDCDYCPTDCDPKILGVSSGAGKKRANVRKPWFGRASR